MSDARYPEPINGWTLKTIKEYVDQRFGASEKSVSDALAAADKAVAAAMAAAEKAVTKAEVAAEKRFDAVNEFRGQQKDLLGTFLPRSEFYWAVGLLLTLILGVAAIFQAKGH
jgi:hypothetical protein